MKRNLTVIGILLVFLIAGNGCHNPWHDRSEMKESGKMIRMRMGHNLRHFREMSGMRGMMGQGMRNGMMRGMGPRMGFGIMEGMRRMQMDSIGYMPMAPGRRIMESIPNVTENQKKQIEDLTKKHFDEMKKLREEMYSKMQNIIDSQRKEVLNILTDDQKKYLVSRGNKLSPVPEKTK
ncbi:MAG: hypothetical protein WA816_01720 [Bacteroidales bacterium]